MKNVLRFLDSNGEIPIFDMRIITANIIIKSIIKKIPPSIKSFDLNGVKIYIERESKSRINFEFFSSKWKVEFTGVFGSDGRISQKKSKITYISPSLMYADESPGAREHFDAWLFKSRQ